MTVLPMVSARQQLALETICEQIEAGSIGNLPDGVSELSIKEINFVRHYLETGRKADAARKAGYSVHSAHEIARKLFKKVEVRRFYAHCVKQISENAGLLLARIWERSVIAHSRILDLEMQADFNEGKLTETQRKSLKDYYRVAKDNDTLLAGILGKLPTLNLNLSASGEGKLVITQQTAHNLAQMRQEVIRGGLN